MATGQRAPVSEPIGVGQRAPVSGSYRGATSGPIGVGQRAPVSGPYRSSTSGPISGIGQRAANSSVRRAHASMPMDADWLRADVDSHRLGRRRSARRSSSVTLATILAAVVIVGVALSVGGMKLFARPSAAPHATPRPTATATALPTATPTVAKPTATATQTAQQQLDLQASSAFRAITLARFADGSCASGSMTTSFNGGAPVFVNLCVGGSPAPGPVTVQVRQHGVVVRTLITNAYMSAGSSYNQGHTLGAGSYDMLVTMRINGVTATARDIPFTVQ